MGALWQRYGQQWTYDSGTIKTYANGSLIHTYSGSGVIGDAITGQNDFRIGGRQVITQHFQGRIDDVRVYNRALTATEVGALANGSASAVLSVNWLVADHLGTPRMIIDQTGTLANIKRHDYLPFGEELFAPSGGRSTSLGYSGGEGIRQQFTQKERDVETGLDYVEARYYSSVQGRFTSVDPQNAEAASDLTDSQGWNGYAYVKNNPCSNTDPDGRCICLWQRLKNAAYGFRSNEEVQALEDKWRNYLREKQQQYGRELVWVGAPGTGIVIVDPNTLSRDDVFKYARLFRDAEYDGRLQLYSEEDMQKIKEAQGMAQPPPVPVLAPWRSVTASRPLD